MNQNRLIVGGIVLAVLMILVITASTILLRQKNNEGARIGQREPITPLGYCGSNRVRPCILSFELNTRGRMVINVLINRFAPRNFYIKIRHEGAESIYKCRKLASSSTNFSCRGEAMPMGEPLQFLMISTKKNILLAEGSFPIIGLALAPPKIALPPTPTPPVLNHPPR